MAGIVAKNYCDAIFALAQEDGKLDLYKEQLLLVDETLQDERYRFVMTHPKISHEEKKRLLDTVYKDTLDHTLLNFLKLLVDKGRFCSFHEIVKEYRKRYNIEKHIQVVYVSSADSLQAEEIEKLKTTLEQKLQKTVELRLSVDKDLLAGMRIRIDDKIIDNSAKARLERLRKHVALTDIME